MIYKYIIYNISFILLVCSSVSVSGNTIVNSMIKFPTLLHHVSYPFLESFSCIRSYYVSFAIINLKIATIYIFHCELKSTKGFF